MSSTIVSESAPRSSRSRISSRISAGGCLRIFRAIFRTSSATSFVAFISRLLTRLHAEPAGRPFVPPGDDLALPGLPLARGGGVEGSPDHRLMNQLEAGGDRFEHVGANRLG